MSTTVSDDRVGAVRGTALFVAAIVGPGILTLPALAAAQAGPASLVTLAALLAASAPIALTFAGLHRALPSVTGVAGYAAAAFGPLAGQLVTAWFRYGVPLGVPALGLIGGEYVAEATGGGKVTVVVVAVGICGLAVTASIVHRAGSGVLTLLLSLALTVLIGVTAVLAVPHANSANLAPFAPQGVAGAAASALVLTWVLTGWEAVTNFTGVLRNPGRTLPRVTAATLVVVTLLYGAVAVPEILVLGPAAGGTGAPLAAMLDIAVGGVGAAVAAALSVIIATGNSMAYVGSLAELGQVDRPAASQDQTPTMRARALTVPIAIIIAGLAAAALTPIGIEQLVALCAGSQVPVYVLGLAAGLKIFPALSRPWWLSVLATAAVTVLFIPAGLYLLVPAGIAAGILLRRASRCAGKQSLEQALDASNRHGHGQRCPWQRRPTVPPANGPPLTKREHSPVRHPHRRAGPGAFADSTRSGSVVPELLADAGPRRRPAPAPPWRRGCCAGSSAPPRPQR